MSCTSTCLLVAIACTMLGVCIGMVSLALAVISKRPAPVIDAQARQHADAGESQP